MMTLRNALVAGPAIAPVWYVLKCHRQAWAANWLEAQGVEAWYPTDTRFVTREKQGKRTRVQVIRPVVTGFVFAAFRGVPMWHMLKERSFGRVTGVLCVGDVPRRFTDAEMMAMNDMPHRIASMREAEAARLRINAGDDVRHPVFGRVKVTGVDGPLAQIIAPMFGGEREVSAVVADLEKIT